MLPACGHFTVWARCNTWARSVYGRWAGIGVRPTYAPLRTPNTCERRGEPAALFLKSFDFLGRITGLASAQGIKF